MLSYRLDHSWNSVYWVLTVYSHSKKTLASVLSFHKLKAEVWSHYTKRNDSNTRLVLQYIRYCFFHFFFSFGIFFFFALVFFFFICFCFCLFVCSCVCLFVDLLWGFFRLALLVDIEFAFLFFWYLVSGMVSVWYIFLSFPIFCLSGISSNALFPISYFEFTIYLQGMLISSYTRPIPSFLFPSGKSTFVVKFNTYNVDTNNRSNRKKVD